MGSHLFHNSHSPSSYDITLKINHEKANFTGVMEISLERSSHGPDAQGDDFTLTLNSSELVLMNAIIVANDQEHKAKISYVKANELANLSFAGAKVLYNVDNLTLKINYIGKINTIKTFKDVTKGLFKTNYLDDRANKATNYVLATHCQTSFARCIFPCVDETSSRALFKLTVETAATFKVVSNTSPESKIVDEKENVQTIQFKQTPLMAPSIFGFVLGNLDFIETKVLLQQGISIPLRFYTTIGNIAGATYALDIASKVLPFVESLLKRPYPLDKLDFVALPFLSDGAMENNGLICIQAGHVLSQSLANKKATQQIRQLVVHEIVHHWVGNNVSFKSWDDLWLNEAFATWLAYYVLAQLDFDPVDKQIWKSQVDEELENVLDQDSQDGVLPVVHTMSKQVKSTHDAFQVPSYQKGLQFLRMFANIFENGSFDDQLTRFCTTLGTFLIKNDYKTISSGDLWNAFSEQSSLELNAFADSWLTTAGFPLLSVSLNDEKKIVVEQSKFTDTTTVDDKTTYHVPLAIRLTDGTIVNKIRTEKRIVLDDIKLEQFVNLNANRTGFYRVSYDNMDILDNLVKHSNELSSLDLMGLLHDMNHFIGHARLQKEITFVMLVKLSEKLLSAKELDFDVLRTLLTLLETVENSYKMYADKEAYMKFSDWLISANAQLFNRLQWDDNFAKYNSAELQTRALLMSIGLTTPEVGKVGEKLFKKLLHGPNRSVPAHLLNAVLASVSLRANQSTWKKILDLVKSSISAESHIFAGSGADIQNAAISAIGFTKDPALVKRVLNFVTTNIESNLIETALVGLQFNIEVNKKTLWDWFKLNYDQWALKSCRAGSQISTNMRKTLKGITVIVLAGMTTTSDRQAVDEFVHLKLGKLPEHELSETARMVQESQVEKLKIAESAVELVKYL